MMPLYEMEVGQSVTQSLVAVQRQQLAKSVSMAGVKPQPPMRSATLPQTIDPGLLED